MIALDKLESSSELFKRYLDNKDFIKEFFPANELIFNNLDYLSSISTNKFRNSTLDCIKETMSCIELSNNQTKNLELFSRSNSLAVVTGQQVGFLGGPLYTFYKIASAVNWSVKFKSLHSDLDFIPIFWVEDNDHDLSEASKSFIYDNNNSISEINCFENIDKSNRKIVGKMKFDDSISTIIDNIIELLPHSQYKNNAKEIIKNIYLEGESLTNAFIKLLNLFFSESGLLFISANKSVEMGLFKSVASFEIENHRLSSEKIDFMNELLLKQNLHIQAKHSELNLFYHIDNERHKIKYNKVSDNFSILEKTYSKSQLLEMLNNYPCDFSPAALIRPIFQDTILPTAAYIAGAGEIAYCSQIRELYPLFGIKQGAIINRHHLVILSPKIRKTLNKYCKTLEYFLHPFANIENELLESIKAKEDNNIIQSAKEEFSSTMEKVKNYAITIDTNLESTTTATLHNIIKQFENVEKKINSAIKKSNEEIINKYHDISNWLYPNNTHQERVLSLLTLILLNDTSKFNDIHIYVSSNDYRYLSIFEINN
jgi:bacillithiol synthase